MDDAVAQIRGAGWSQGSAVQLPLPWVVAQQAPSNGFRFFVLSQDCDLVHRSLSVEPTFEVLGFERVLDEAIDNSLLHAKNPRQLIVRCTEGNAFRFDVRKRCLVNRDLLTSCRVDESVTFEAAVVQKIARWVAKRYTRAAFPDAFNERLRPAGPAIKKALKRHGQYASSLYIRLEPQAECSEEEPYTMLLVILSPEGVMADEVVEEELAKLQSTLESALSKCDGIELEDSSLLGEDEFSLHDLRLYARWDFDERSYSGQPGGEISPDG